ncbi:uncharacterized protein K452DRAFT_332619 [Aplosporella prunicola CBS 121167]|uniref:Uncharacterized protein n=1 Tax=Aplosporella prunicola CBS 121167 TaxID=1176127 RepID=A0A6A6BGB8_9PEZI|nr:uncharacterized protein K452DRAFT_332619 [Aplosporella prunicola CBS 121167]KAF2141917.1 hypothetical protein K452DRAFT_332619 [Aplosporella prunicola CBS 121167]
MASSFESIAQWRVTPDNPPREIDGLDSERCAALHNFVVQHGWNSYHGTPVDLNTLSSWWTIWGNDAESLRPKLHPSLVDFLQRAYVTPWKSGLSFFTYLHGLNGVGEFWFHDVFGEPERTVTLYVTHTEFGSNPDGLVYDQADHTVRMNFSMEDISGPEVDSANGWMKLECVLSIYIDMIERGKAVALSKQMILDREDAPEIDPVTGTFRLGHIFKPWTMVPYSSLDIEDTITIWNELVAEIERRMPGYVEDKQDTPQYGLLDATQLDAAGIPQGFARELLSRVRKPNFTFIAPGIRVPTLEEFIEQPFRRIEGPHFEPDFRWAIRLFMIEHTKQYSETEVTWPIYLQQSRMPCGVFFDFCWIQAPCPFEDSMRVELPFKLACRSDGSTPGLWETDYTHLYGMRHRTQLLAILENMYEALILDNWQVDSHGVAGGIAVFEEASMEQLEQFYRIPVGPGYFW